MFPSLANLKDSNPSKDVSLIRARLRINKVRVELAKRVSRRVFILLEVGLL